MGQSGRLQQRYIEALDLCAVAVMAPAGAVSPVRLDLSHGVEAAADGETCPVYSLWCPRIHHAVFLRGRCIDALSSAGVRAVRGWLDTDTDTARDAIVHAAASLRIKTATMSVVRANAAAAVARIVDAVEAARVSGGLKQLNAAYKTHRLQAERSGAGAISYSEFLGRFVERLTALVAASARQTPGGEFGDLGGCQPEYILSAIEDTESSASSAQKA